MKKHLFLAVTFAAALAAYAQEGADPYKKSKGPGDSPAGAGSSGGAPAGMPGMEGASGGMLMGGGAMDMGPTNLAIREETFSLPIADAHELVTASNSDPELYGKLRELVKSGKARVERMVLVRTKSGQRAVTESHNELRYASERFSGAAPAANLPPEQKNRPVSAYTYETRNAGDTLEIEAVVGPDGQTMDVNLVPNIVRFAGYDPSPNREGLKQPVFESQKFTTSVSMRAGEPFLLATLNPPFGNNLALEKNEQRIWLDFMTIDLLKASRASATGRSKVVEFAQIAIIPKLQFEEATLAEAIEFLRVKSREMSPDHESINIVLKVPPSYAQAKITLSLANVPLLEALKYIAATAGLTYTAHENALVVHPPGEGH